MKSIIRKCFFVRTLIGTHGYSGKAAATALAPASFVHCDNPTKNSFPKIIFKWF